VYYRPPSSLSRDKLEEYRKQWTTDTEIGRTYRFNTETRLAGNAISDKFQTHSVRFLPGTPKSLENFREKLVEKYGILALCVLRFSLGKSEIMSSREFKSILNSLGIDLKQYEIIQVRAINF
jgi:hypothetical protein